MITKIIIEFKAKNEETLKHHINLLKAYLEREKDIPPKIKYKIKEGTSREEEKKNE